MRRVRSFVNDLFEIARLEIGDELDLEPIPPLELIADAARSLRPQADLGGIQLHVTAHPAVEDVSGDGHRLMRACENLLSNAIRHASDHVRIGAVASAQDVCLFVEDDGLGFGGPKGPVDLSTVSKQAAQADSSGLGLLVARGVAEAHGGSIAASNGSHWTRVELRIPRDSSNQPAE
ncbi:MAG: two-component system sensor histidine kinase BaeS [Planctomycetota bacterium]